MNFMQYERFDTLNTTIYKPKLDSICINQKSAKDEIVIGTTYVAPPSELDNFIKGVNLYGDGRFTSKAIQLDGVAFATAL